MEHKGSCCALNPLTSFWSHSSERWHSSQCPGVLGAWRGTEPMYPLFVPPADGACRVRPAGSSPCPVCFLKSAEPRQIPLPTLLESNSNPFGYTQVCTSLFSPADFWNVNKNHLLHTLGEKTYLGRKKWGTWNKWNEWGNLQCSSELRLCSTDTVAEQRRRRRSDASWISS